MSKQSMNRNERELNSAPSSSSGEDARHINQFCESLKTLSNPHRLRIMMSLQDGEASVGDLELGLKIKQPNLSHELRKLRDKGMVKTRRQSKVVFYSIADQNTAGLIRDISILLSDEQVSSCRHEHKDARSRTESFSERESHGECGRFPMVQQS